MMEKALCKPCAVALSRRGWKLKAHAGRSEKITCEECRRRRYGVTYDAVPTKEGKNE